MRVLFDNGTLRGVATALSEHAVEEARAHGWDTLSNGELLDAAEAAGFDVFVTTVPSIVLMRLRRLQCVKRIGARRAAGGYVRGADHHRDQDESDSTKRLKVPRADLVQERSELGREHCGDQ